MRLEPIDIKCPDCGGLAKFEEPFDFLDKKELKPDENRPIHQWGAGLLWAWDKEHAQVILNFVKEKVRPSRRSPILRYVPSHFLSAKVRNQAVQKMERSIGPIIKCH